MSSSSDTTKLITTALGAAVAGAAIALGAVKFMETNSNNKKKDSTMDAATLGMDGRPIRRSFIYEDTSGDINMNRDTSSSTLLFPHNHEEKMRRRVVARAAVEEDNMTPRRLVTVRVPATSANVGPGCKYCRLAKEVESGVCSCSGLFCDSFVWRKLYYPTISNCCSMNDSFAHHPLDILLICCVLS